MPNRTRVLAPIRKREMRRSRIFLTWLFLLGGCHEAPAPQYVEPAPDADDGKGRASVAAASKEEEKCSSVQQCTSASGCACVRGECLEASLENCQHSHQCEVDGLCDFLEGKCVATREKDCAESLSCQEKGNCGLIGQECLPLSRAHCEAASLCGTIGACSFLETGKCVAGLAADCSGAAICSVSGQCHVMKGQCVAQSSEDCSTPCRKYGHCQFSNGECVAASDADCQQSEGCKDDGLCSLESKTCTWKASVANQ